MPVMPVMPRFHTKPSKRKAKWSSNLGQRQVKAGIKLQDQKPAQQFKSLKLPDSIAYLGPKLKKGKSFEDAELRVNATGTFSLAALTCAKSSHAFADKINSACNAPLPPLLNASQKELDELKAWRDDIRQEVAAWNSHIKIASDVGTKLSAGKEMEAIRHSPINNILLNSSPPRPSFFRMIRRLPRPWRPQKGIGLTLPNPPSPEVVVPSLEEGAR
jgi:hypothetical protein